MRVRPAIALSAILLAGACSTPPDEPAPIPTIPATTAPVTTPAHVPTTEVLPPMVGAQDEIWPAELIADCDPTVPSCERPWEEAWAGDRRRIVERIVDHGWGVGDDNVLRGPGGLAIDLDDCPYDWDPIAGITDDEIRLTLIAHGPSNLGLLGPESGVLSYLQAVNAAGGIRGRMVRVGVFEDGYAPQATAAFVERVVDEGSWFAATTTGAATLDASSASLGAACIPHPLVMPGATEGIVGVRPFTIPGQFGYATEIELTVRYLAESWTEPLPPRVAALVMNDEFGSRRLSALTAAVERYLPGAELVVASHGPAVQSLAVEVATLIEAAPDVLLLLAVGHPCLLTVLEVGKVEVPPPFRFLPSACRDPAPSLIPAADRADGWLTLVDGPDFLTQMVRGEGSMSDWIKAHLEAGSVDWNYQPSVDGWHWAWHYVELLRIADALPGGLTRPNFLLAAWAADLRPPLNWPGITFTLNGPSDPHPVEAAQLVQWASRTETWIPIGFITAD